MCFVAPLNRADFSSRAPFKQSFRPRAKRCRYLNSNTAASSSALFSLHRLPHLPGLQPGTGAKARHTRARCVPELERPAVGLRLVSSSQSRQAQRYGQGSLCDGKSPKTTRISARLVTPVQNWWARERKVRSPAAPNA